MKHPFSEKAENWDGWDRLNQLAGHISNQEPIPEELATWFCRAMNRANQRKDPEAKAKELRLTRPDRRAPYYSQRARKGYLSDAERFWGPYIAGLQSQGQKGEALWDQVTDKWRELNPDIETPDQKTFENWARAHREAHNRLTEALNSARTALKRDPAVTALLSPRFSFVVLPYGGLYGVPYTCAHLLRTNQNIKTESKK